MSLQIYDVTITLEDIGRNKILKAFYDSIEEFKERLVADLDSWTVAENGDVTYQF